MYAWTNVKTKKSLESKYQKVWIEFTEEAY